ncbi:4-hydroxy-tetrahydrodipicolinate reductase [Chloroflexota bacterium]
MEPIKVVVQGVFGKVGWELAKTLCREPDMQLVGAVELQVSEDYLAIPEASGRIPLAADLEHIVTTCRPDVLVDFTIAQAVMPAVRIAAKHRVNLVIGTTGLAADELDEIGRLAVSNKVGTVVAPNFSLGAVLMVYLAKLAARYLDYAEIIELHHDRKADAPSGTALSTARAMAQARGKPFSRPREPVGNATSRGKVVEGINVHSVRLPGLMAHQEVILGAAGQTLRIRHDTINQECYMPGVMLAIREVVKRQGLTYGLDDLLGLQETL